MEIDRTTFGTITIDGKIYEHDVIIRVSGEVVKRHLDPSWALVAGERLEPPTLIFILTAVLRDRPETELCS
ncbi:hypothetical protein V1290_005350 [Bradyrhizobium sp. AZCC 1578]|uniref:hypothetical protein n=1 Tax=Bradyrhizobium sp. AZCC 1578 TaxID=3117027 RepID=UPI002FF37490